MGSVNRKGQRQQHNMQLSASSSAPQIQPHVRHHSSSEPSPLSTISPASFSESPHGCYDFETNIVPNLDTGSRHILDEFQVMSGQYNSPILLDRQTDWPLQHYKLPPQQQHLQQNIGHIGSTGSAPNLQSTTLSPTHMQAMLQRANHGSPLHRIVDYQPNGSNGQIYQTGLQQRKLMPQHHLQQQPQQTVQQPLQQQQHPVSGYAHIEQYPTPPSHNSQHITDSPPHQHNVFNSFRHDHLLTPSPDSPGHWSSSSPHSAHSDWSEGISSPVPAITHGPNRTKHTEPAYF